MESQNRLSKSRVDKAAEIVVEPKSPLNHQNGPDPVVGTKILDLQVAIDLKVRNEGRNPDDGILEVKKNSFALPVVVPVVGTNDALQVNRKTCSSNRQLEPSPFHSHHFDTALALTNPEEGLAVAMACQFRNMVLRVE